MKTLQQSVLCLMFSAFSAFAAELGPMLIADYNRDGKIDPVDYDRMAKGEAFTVWLNDDNDAAGAEADDGKGDTNSDLHDVPGGNEKKDCEDLEVNGRCDLLDFFPVLIDLNGVDNYADLTWKLSSDSVNVVFTGLSAGNAGCFHTMEVKSLDDETPLYKAEVKSLAGEDEGVALPGDFLKEGRGVILVEGAALGDEGLTLRGEKEGGDPIEVTLDLRVVDVEKMYGWMNLRKEGGGETVTAPRSEDAAGTVKDNRHFVLVHGYNTNHEEARGNAAEFYKKLYQSGSDAMFTAVEWRGDQSQIEILGLNVTPNYFVNVENAFAAARPFAEACKQLPGEKILVGHSLGNVLISSAIKDYGLDYTKYVMLNAAVAREAYDVSAYDKDMVDEDWLGDEVKVKGEGEGKDPLTNHLDRAARWYRNFADRKYDPYEYRRKLAWRGRFANLPRTVNYYSQSDNILVNPAPNEPDPDEILDRNDPDLYRKIEELLVTKLVNGRSIGSGGSKKTGFGFWSFSEKMKGTWLLDVVNDVLTNTFEVAQADAYKREGGWGENEDYDDDLEKPFDPANTRFTPFLDERLKTQGMLDILPAETERVRAQHLADAIPAESFAAGANPVATLENVDEESFIGENLDWPLFEGEEIGAGRTNVWNHSAFREVAFYHTSKFYASLAATGKPRVIIDTDLGSSMDDLFVVDLAARMHKQGKLDLMAVMMDRPDKFNPEKDGEFLTFADRYLASLGLGDLPIGKAMMPADSQTSQYVFNPYWTLIYSNNVTGVGLLLPTNRTPDQIESLTNAVALYRRLLHDLPDGQKVVICSTGFLTNLKGLMESEENEGGDGIWSTGLELIEQKVKELRIMGGWFDLTTEPADGEHGAEYNFAGDPAAAKKVVEEWPTPVVVSPWEVGLKLDYKTPNVLEDFPPGTFDPVVRAAHIYWPEPLGDDDKNRLWDPATILPLTEGEAFLPLSEKGGVSVDGFGKTTFTPDPSGNRRYQVASKMNATAVMNRIREICRTGNPSLPEAVRCIKDAGVDYNGHDLTFKVPKFSLGAYGSNDVHMAFAFGDKSYVPDEVTYDPVLEVFSVHFTVPEEDATAGNVYNGALTITLENDEIGPNVVKTVPMPLVQGRQEQAEPMTDWFNETNLEAPTNYVPATAMPERCLATVETTFLFEAPVEATDEPPEGVVQGAVRIVVDGADGYKFQYFACVGKTNEDSFVRGWWDFNVGGEEVSEIKPVLNKEYTVRAEADYFDDARGGENTLVISVKEGDNGLFHKQFVGNIINRNGGQGGTTRLNSVEFAGDGTVSSLVGNYYTNTVNASLAQIDGGDAVATQYATVAEAVAAANGNPIRLLWKARWKPTTVDLGTPVKFLNKSWLNLDLSGLPANARAVWTDVDGNNGTLTLELVYADTVVYGTIRTAEEGNSVAEALAVKDGKYVSVGDATNVAAFVKDGVTQVVDHRGKGMVMPGCTDGHSHYTMHFALPKMKGGVMLAKSDDKAAILQKLKAGADAAKAAGKGCIFGFGWDFYSIRLGDGLPLAEIDEVTKDVSAVIFDSSGHNAYCNSECLRRCGIIDGEGKALVDKIDGGLLELDENGCPTGFVDERVTGYLMRMGGVNADELVDDEVAADAIRKTQEVLLSTGYTIAMEGWGNYLHPSKLYAAANRIDTNGELKIVFPMTYEVEPWQTNMTEQIDYLASLKETYGTRHVLPEYLKVFMDGCVETFTGALSKPYKFFGTTFKYKSFWPTNRLADITAACNAKGLTVHTHVMGDVAIKETTDAYIQGGDGTHRNCLVHLRNVNTNDFQRMADNNIACTAGLTWHVSGTEALIAIVDEEYAYHSYPIRSFFDAGVKVSSHSDFPANAPCPQDPFGMMHVAVTGLLPDPPDGMKPYDTNELVTVEQAFQALTLNGAWQLGLENERGSIKVGKWADFVLADQDVFTCATNDIHKTKVVSTWFEGEKAFEATAKVSLPAGIQGGSYVVSNLTEGVEIAASESMLGGATYELPIGAKVAIYVVPAAGYIVTGTNPYVIEEVTAETTLEGVTLPWAVDYADTVVYGTIRTAEKGNPVAEAVAVKDGKYVYVGDEAGVAAFIEDGVTEVVDHRGKGMVMPGCTDGHSHYTMKFGLDNMKGGVMFDDDDDKDAILRKLEAAAKSAEASGKESLFGFGWDFATIMLGERPTLAELDKVTYGVSTVIFDSTVHNAFCNSVCLRRCGIIDGEGNLLVDKIDGGLLELDECGRPTGYVNERVTGYLMRMGGINQDEIIDDEVAESTMRATQKLLLSTGYTMTLEGWSNLLHPSKFYETAHRMDTNGELKLVFPMTYEVEPWQTNLTEQIDYLASLKETYGTRHVRPEYLKIFMDGCVETLTGAISKPYKGTSSTYKSFWATNRLAEITRVSNDKDLTVHIHAMGDVAIQEATDAYIQGGDGVHRNCLVHLRNVRQEDFKRFADNNIACTAGMTWHVTMGEEGDLMRQFIEDEFVDHSYPIKSFFDAGVKVSSHSDFPANEGCPQDPFGILQVAVTGLDPRLPDGAQPYDPDELITLEQAFQALTINGAWQLGLENERGSIKVGKWADFVLADQDVFECAATDIGKTKVVSTWFEGEKVYEAPTTVTLPSGVQGYSYVVSNLTAGAEAEIAPAETAPGGTAYELPIGAKVAIYAVPAAGYVVTGTNPYVIEKVTAETTLEGVTLPTAVKPVVADTVVYGTIRTAEEGNPVAEALAVKGGRYVYVGDEAGVAAFIEDGVTKVVDHRGKGMVMPGCTDGHSHYTLKFSLANIKGGVMFDLNDDKTKVLQKLETAALAAQKSGKTCLYGFGWNFLTLTLRFGGDQPTLKELDDATHGVSTVIFDQGGHHTFCNSECLKRCGIIDGNGKVLITEIDGGYLELDDKGYPTGYAEERVTGYLTRMGGINYDELVDDEVAEAALRASQELLLSTGCTIALEGWSNTLHPSKFYEAAHRMDTNGTLKLVFPMTYEVEPWQTNMTEQIDYLDSLNKTYRTSHVLPEYLKIFMDGVVETKTGAMLKPYVDDKKTYASFWSTNRLADITRECNGRGLTVHVHTMGDAAVRDTVEAYIQGGDGTHRNCLVHLRNVSTNGVNDFERMAQNNIACTAGFTWHVGTKDDVQMEAFLDKEYVYHAYPMKSFFDAGVRVSSHSDFPANAPSPQDPFGIMEVAVTGQRPDLPADEKCPSYDPDELVTVEQVFQALTLNGAWQLGLENERGSIKVGKWADFVLADQDVFTCVPNDIGKTKVVSTWFEGEKVFEAAEPVPVTPDEPIVCDTAEEASNVLKRAVFTPSTVVEERLGGEGSTALNDYCAMFTLDVVPAEGGTWAVTAGLTPEGWTNVVESAQDATRQLPVAALAAREYGKPLENVPLTNCVPGFYYSLYNGAVVTNIKANVNPDDCNILCGPGTTVEIPVLPQPSPASGFFSIGVLEVPSVIPGETETATNLPSHKKPGDRSDIL